MKTPALAALALAGCALAPTSIDAPASLAAAESAFAAHSVREDMRAAFIAAFAEDGVFVREGWTGARAWLAPRPAPPIILDWRPVYVEVAASGEIGLSTGPWKLAARDKPREPSYGQFVSVWRRDAAGAWKVEVDLGVGHPRPSLWEAPLEARSVAPAPAAAETLAQAEERFAREAARDTRAAYRAFGAEDLRFYRDGQAPTASRAAALASAAMPAGATLWTTERMQTARSGDFGYARGRYASASAPAAVAGWFLRVWRREGRDWRIALDVVQPPRG